MKLTEKFTIEIPEKKIIGYVLSMSRKLGSHKANYFKSYGYTSKNSFEFTQAIKNLVDENEIVSEPQNKFGVSYVVDGKIKSPSKKMIVLRTAWIVEKKSKVARLITVFPKK